MRQSFEIHVLQNGRWTIHAQFSATQRDAAVEEAHTAERLRGVQGVKVIQDLYDANKGVSHENVVYMRMMSDSPSPQSAESRPAPRRAASSMGRGGGRVPDFKIDLEDKPATTGVGVLTKLLLIILISLFIASLVGIVVGETLPRKLAGVWLVGTTRDNIVFGGAIVVFLTSVVMLLLRFMADDTIQSRPHHRRRRKRKKPGPKPAIIEKKADEATASTSGEHLEEAISATDEHKEEALAELEKARAEKEAAEAEKQFQEDAAVEQEEAVAEEEEEGEAPSLDSLLSPFAEKQLSVVMEFFKEALTALPPEMQKMDNFNKFGVNLYMAGAAEMISTEKELDPISATTILRRTVKLMGYKDEHADAFAARYHEYLLQDARYMTIFQAGRADMKKVLDGEEGGPSLEETLNAWNKPKAPEDNEREVVVLFTDIVGSTAMTHEKGNVGAQKIVRSHNKIVREALNRTSGQEIKHTGDGIMASYEEIPKAILGASEMQRLIVEHNAQHPDLPVRVKIGLAAGRVVAEDNDLFGVTVQMAARITDKAHEGQVLVSDVIHGMMKGSNLRFVKRGPYMMKGIDGPAYLYEVIWNPNADIEAIEANAAEEGKKLAAYAEATGGDTANAPKGDDIPELPTAPAQPAAPQQAAAAQTPQSAPTQPQQPATHAQPAVAAQATQQNPQATPGQALKSMQSLQAGKDAASGTQVNRKT